jgi:hypothetical protein
LNLFRKMKNKCFLGKIDDSLLSNNLNNVVIISIAVCIILSHKQQLTVAKLITYRLFEVFSSER